jgi:uncharacterized membrane protein YfcA
MRPRSIILFERLLFLALTMDLVNNLTSWPRLSKGLDARGVSPHPAAILIMCLASPLVGIIFWYFTARRGNVVAKWLLTIFVGASVVGFVGTAFRGVEHESVTLFGVAAVAELLKVVAASRLFTADAKSWFARSRRESLARQH